MYGLGRGSAFVREIEGPWGDVEHLLAYIGDQAYRTAELVKGAHFSAGAGSKKPYQPRTFVLPRPKRPGEAVEADRPPRMSEPAEIRAFFGAAASYVPEEVNHN